jgi:hypothetical protein
MAFSFFYCCFFPYSYGFVGLALFFSKISIVLNLSTDLSKPQARTEAKAVKRTETPLESRTASWRKRVGELASRCGLLISPCSIFLLFLHSIQLSFQSILQLTQIRVTQDYDWQIVHH